MKRILLFLSIIIVCGIVINGCIYEKISEAENGNTDPENPTKSLVFRLSATATNNNLGQDISNATIGLFLKNSKSASMQTNNPITLSSGYKEQTLADGSDSLGYCYAYYPYSSDINDNTYSGEISSTQDQAVSTSTDLSSMPSSISNQLLMISTTSDKINFNNTTASIQFNNAFSLMRFAITANSELLNEPTFTTQKIKSFEMYFSSSTDSLTPLINIAGKYSIDLSKSPGSSSYTGPNFSSYASKIYANITGSPVLNSSTPIVVWIAIPPLSALNANMKLVVKLETEGVYGSETIKYNTFSTVKGFSSIARNTMLSVPIVLGKGNVYSDDVVKESFKNPANTYIISEEGLYRIPAKKISGAVVPGGTSVDWLWASVEGGSSSFDIADLISKISYSNDTIQFRIGSSTGSYTKGNVILALKNAANDIVWTWHIWITDTPTDVQYDGNQFLDRNIGALSADMSSSSVDNYGFVYQWGRKEPLFGGDGATYDEGISMFSVANAHTIINTSSTWTPNAAKWSAIATTSAIGAVSSANRFPMRFIYNSDNATSTWGTNPADWLYTSVSTLWSETKTDYDPCPYGYRVPSKAELATLHSGYTSQSSFLSFSKSSNKYWEYKYFKSTVNGEWPAAGMRQGRQSSLDGYGAQLKYSGTNDLEGQCFYWTCTPASIASAAGGSYRIHTANGILYSDDDYGDNADAYPVRCIKK